MSMLRHAASTEPTRPVTLIYGVHTEEELAFRDELATAARRHPQLRIHLAVSTGNASPEIYPGRIDESLLRTTVPDLASSIVCICGPTPMIDGMKALLAAAGVPADQVRHEIFNPADARSAGSSRAPAAAGPTRSAHHQVTCTKSRKAIRIDAGQTLLEAAEQGGLTVDSLCRAGVCGTCRVQVSDGEVDCQSDTLDADDRSQGVVLACVTTAQTDCTVNL
jgi:ferredoxin-NADP reductase